MAFLFNPKESNHSTSTSTGSLDELFMGTPSNSGNSVVDDNLTTSKKNNNYYPSSLSSSSFVSASGKDGIETITFSFAAAGWLQVFLFGCAHALIENVPGVRIEGLDDTYAEYMAKKVKKELDERQQQQEQQRNYNFSSSSSQPTTVSSPRKLDETQEFCADSNNNESNQPQTAASIVKNNSLSSTSSSTTKNHNSDTTIFPSSTTSPNHHHEEQQKPPLFRFVGSSAGSLASAAILLGTDMTDMLEYAVGCVNYARSHWIHAFELRKFVEQGIAKFAIDIFQKKHKEKLKVEKDDDDDDSLVTPESTPPRTPEAKDLDDEIVENNNNNDDANAENKKRKLSFEVLRDSSATKHYNKDTSVGFFTLLKDAQQPAAAATTTTTISGGRRDDGVGSDNNTTSSSQQQQPNQSHHQQPTTTTIDNSTFPGDEGGWLGTEFFFGKHIRDQLRERLGVYATSLPLIQEICFTEFESTVDLEEALVASCLLAPLAGLPFRLRRTGEWVCDGGLRNFQPRKGLPGVVTISAMYFNAADVAPSVFVPAWWGLYPPPEEQYRQLFALGHNDMLVWLWKNHIVERPATSEERKAKMMKYEESKMPQKHGVVGYILDFFALIFFLGILRPFAFVAIYAELWFVSTIAFIATIFHEFFPTTFDFLIGTHSLRNKKRGGSTRMDSLKDMWDAFSNIISLRTLAHLTFGYRHVNSKRLGKYSRLYRVLKPFVTTTSAASSSNEKSRHRGQTDSGREDEVSKKEM